MTLISRDLEISQTSLYPRRARTLLFAVTALATVMACGTDDEDNDDTDTAVDPLATYTPASMGTNANGVAFPMGVQDWGVASAVARPDNGQVRVLLGNDTAVEAARAGNTNPWPEGTMLSHLAWDAIVNPEDPNSVTTGDFRLVTLIVKDSTKYAADGNWAYGRWAGDMLMAPPTTDMDPLNRGCVDCHTRSVANKDMVFTNVPTFPTQAQLDGLATGPAPTEVAPPADMLDWRFLGIADVLRPNAQMRVLVGNDTAVNAFRNGQTNPWPDGSMISHFVWAATDNPDMGIDGAVVPGNLGAVTLMQRSEARYGDAVWAYGRWAGATLDPLATAEDQQGCVNCHTMNVQDRDMVFNDMGELPDLLK
jgi:hypothetical protein